MIPQEFTTCSRSTFGDAILESKLDGVFDPFITVAPDRIPDVARFLRDNERTQCDALMCLSGVDLTKGNLGVVYHSTP